MTGSTSDVARALASTARPDLLRAIMSAAEKVFGYFDDYFPYTVMYPWVAEHLLDLPAGARVLDMGAGVGAMPLYFGERGLRVDCVDQSSTVRTLPAGDDWNGWGFFDYSVVNPNLAAYNCAIEDHSPGHAYNAIYSVGMLAHMPAMQRDALLRRCHAWLVDGGSLTLAIDVIPASDFLWNRFLDKEVEPPVQHGSIDDLLAMLTGIGFRNLDYRVVRQVYRSRADILLIHCLSS